VVATVRMEKLSDAGRQIAACVIDAHGQIQGYQTKNQLDPTEEPFYPETVRWAATRGARIVFHAQLTGSDRTGVRLTEWGSQRAPFYEKAMMLRSLENTIYFASVNYALRFQEAATSLIAPSGECQAYLPYGQEGVLVEKIDVEEATGLLATRYAPERYRESP
jgi:hypothetical protein